MMQIKLRNNLTDMVKARVNLNKDINPTDRWWGVLRDVSGMTLDVETEHLFSDQYNTAPIPGVDNDGIRVMDWMVDYIIDDARPGKMRCGWCGRTQVIASACSHCGNDGVFKRGTPPTGNDCCVYPNRHFISVDDYRAAASCEPPEGCTWEIYTDMRLQ